MKGGKTKICYPLVKAIYQANPEVDYVKVRWIVQAIFGYFPTRGTVAVWKSRLRAEGIPIPDRRRKQNDRKS